MRSNGDAHRGGSTRSRQLMTRYVHAAALIALIAALPQAIAQTAKKGSGTKAESGAGRETVLVLVNGKKITDADLKRLLMTRQVPEEMRAAERDRFIEQLIETRLMQQFLESRETRASKKEIDEQVN